MNKKAKELLLSNLCARLPYGVICEVTKNQYDVSDVKLSINNISWFDSWLDCKPYLRPLKSMTPEEKKEYKHVALGVTFRDHVSIPNVPRIRWFLEHHIDYCGFIEMGLAIEVTEDNNPYQI